MSTTEFKGYGDAWGWHQDLYNKGAFIPNGWNETRDMEGGQQRIDANYTNYQKGRQIEHVNKMEEWHATLRVKVLTEPHKWIKTEHGYIPKGMPDAMKKAGWSQSMYQTHIASLVDKKVITTYSMAELEDMSNKLDVIGKGIWNKDYERSAGQRDRVKSEKGFDPGPLDVTPMPAPSRPVKPSINTIVFGGGGVVSGPGKTILAPQRMTFPFGFATPSDKEGKTGESGKTQIAASGALAKRDGLAGSVDSLLDVFKLRTKTLYDNYDHMRAESEIAKAASTNQAVLQGMIAKLANASDTAKFDGGDSEAFATFINNHVPAGKKFVDGTTMKSHMTKGDLEELRSHLENLVSSKKSDNERLMLTLSEMTSFLTTMMNLANNIQAMINKMREAIVQSTR
ncbi:hypothetical protein ACPWR0_06125 [Pandoraea pneumonica]|uniref:hypothetical protein n=1 Tax=Pandoraea pneumonica TaxID=2508299 RepID=UPI003CF470FC